MNVLSGEPGRSIGTTFVLNKDEVHVWQVLLNENVSDIPDLMLILSEDEKTHASRFHFQKDHDRFVVARGFLRIILAQYLGTEPSLVQFSTNPFGKPALAMGPDFDSLQFNLSHSHDLAIIALNWGRRIGVDIERIRPGFASERLAQQFLSPRELATFGTLPPNQQEKAFFRYWTCKEAFVKALGEGLSFPPSEFEVLFDPNKPEALLTTGEDQPESLLWGLRSLDVQVGYVASLAVEGRDWHLNYHCWHE